MSEQDLNKNNEKVEDAKETTAKENTEVATEEAKKASEEKAIEKGVNIPESVFNEGKTKNKNESKPIAQIRKAIVLISVGIAGIIFFIFCNSAEMAGLVSMVALIGIGNLIVGILEYRKQQGKAEQEETIENDATKD